MKRVILAILLFLFFIMLNDRAALYYRELTPRLITFLPFDLAIDYSDTKYQLRGKKRKYPVICSESFFPPMGIHEKKIYVKELKAIYWTNDRIIANVLSKDGQKLIELRVRIHLMEDSSTETLVKDYKFVTEKALEEMNDKIVFDEIPIVMRIWPILGLLYLIGIFYLIFNKKVAKLLGD